LRAPDAIARAPLSDELAGIVREAGALAEGKFRGTYKSWTKGGGSPVTDADIAVDNFLRERLMRLAPDCGWLSEETEDDSARLDTPRLWIVDPIDGTRAFASGRTDWAVSVALVENGRPIMAALYAPVEDGLYFAAAGEGTTQNGTPIAVSPGGELAQARAAGPKGLLERLAQAEPAIIAEPKVFSLALRLARVAAGRLEVAFASSDANDWDLAAVDLMVHEAGGTLTDFDGDAAIYNLAESKHRTLVAAGRARHQRVLEIWRERRPAA